MQFCPTCDYMMYIEAVRVDNEDDPSSDATSRAQNVCKNCGYAYTIETQHSVMISQNTTAASSDPTSTMLLSPNIVHDPTIPCMKNIVCTNGSCASNRKKSPAEREVMVIKYDQTNMRFAYHCKVCNHTWKN